MKLTIQEASKVHGVSIPTVRRWIQAGVVNAESNGYRLYIDAEALASVTQGVCVVCGVPFKRTCAGQRYCGKACRQRAYNVQAGRLKDDTRRRCRSKVEA